MSKKQKRINLLGDILGCLVALVIFVIPFYFMLLTALKDKKSAGLMRLELPEALHWENFKEVFEKSDLFLAYKNSLTLTLLSVVMLIIVGSMAGYVIQRREDKVTKLVTGSG